MSSPDQRSTREQWETNKALFTEHTLAQDHVTAGTVCGQHYAPTWRRKMLWFAVIPLGDTIVPGTRPFVTAEGATLTSKGAMRKANRVVSRHLAKAGGRDPHGPLLRGISMSALVVAVAAAVAHLALVLDPPLWTTICACYLALGVGLAVKHVAARRADRLHREVCDLHDEPPET